MHNNNPPQRDELLKRLSILDFMLTDLGLYLDVNPRDDEALALFDTVAQDAQKLRDAYETEFGPLCMRSTNYQSNQWAWVDDPWPWEVEANFEL